MPRCVARWPRSRSTAASGCGTCRWARRRAWPPRSTCRWVTARAGSSRRTREFQIRTLPLIDEDEHILAEYRVRTTDYRPRSRPRARQLRRGAHRLGPHASARRSVRVGDPLLPSTEFDTHDFFARVPLRQRRRREFPAPRRHLPRWLAGPSVTAMARMRRCGPAGVRPAVRAFLGTQHRHSLDLGWHAPRQRCRRRAFVLLAGRIPQLSGVTPDTLVGPNYAILRGIYYRQIGRGGSRIPQRAGVYRGVDRGGQCVEPPQRHVVRQRARPTAACSSASTPLFGPVYFATGFDDGGGSAYYLFLGRTF